MSPRAALTTAAKEPVEESERERLTRWCEIQAGFADEHAALSRSKAKGTENPEYHAEMVGDYEEEARDYRKIAALLRERAGEPYAWADEAKVGGIWTRSVLSASEPTPSTHPDRRVLKLYAAPTTEPEPRV